jgi:hypothetical protein
MKGRWLHNRILLAPVLQAAGANATIRYEVRVDPVQRSRSVDAVIEWPGFRAVVEAENRSEREVGDFPKAIALKGDVLLLVTPTSRVARSIRASLKRAKVQASGLHVLVLTQGAACQWVAHQSHLMSARDVLRTSDIKGHAPSTERSLP